MSEIEAMANMPRLPHGWTWTTLGDVCSPPQYGWTTSARGTGKLKLLRTTDITPGQIDWSQVPFCETDPPNPEKYLLQPGDVVISRAGSVGYSHLITSTEPAVFASYLIRFHPVGINPVYLSYFLKSPAYWDAISEAKLGIAVQNVNATKLKEIQIPLPPLSEQKTIVEIIETHFTRLDAAVVALKRVQANLRRYRAAVLKAACEGRLVPTEAELAQAEGRTYEPAAALLERILAERRAQWQVEHPGKKYKEPAGPDVSALPELPEGWCWATVEQVAAAEPNSITDGPFGSNLKTEHYTDDGPRVIRLQNIGDGQYIDEYAHISQSHFEKLLRHQVLAGDIVIAALGTELPRACIVPDFVGPAIVKADCIRFKVDSQIAHVEYVHSALNSRTVKSIAARVIHGVGRPRLNQQEIKALPIPLPPRVEQDRIAEALQGRLSILAHLNAELDQQGIRSSRLRQSILQRAFSGQLVKQQLAQGSNLEQLSLELS